MRSQPGVGSVWTWTALDADTKLMIAWRLRARDFANASAFIRDVKERLANRVQLMTDGNTVYLNAVLDHFAEVGYAILQKLFGPSEEGPEARYSPPKCNGTKKKVERQNLNVRMQNRRYTRLTNAFSKKFEMLAYSVAITFFYHNFVRIHQVITLDASHESRNHEP